MFESKTASTYGQGQAQGVAKVVNPDSLASVAPRLITLCQQVASGTTHIEGSFGISSPESKVRGLDQAAVPTLLEQLRRCESLLEDSISSLENINRHVNG